MKIDGDYLSDGNRSRLAFDPVLLYRENLTKPTLFIGYPLSFKLSSQR
jgi:hypothetical protein